MGYVPEAVQVVQRAGNYVDISLWGKKRIMKYIRPRSQPPLKLLDKRCEVGEVSIRHIWLFSPAHLLSFYNLMLVNEIRVNLHT